MQWSPSLSVGDVRIDDQHQNLFRLAAALRQRHADNDATMAAAAIAELRTYVTKHLRDEEALLRSINYKDLQSHCALHREFEATLEYLGGRLATEPPAAVLRDIEAFVATWLVDHISKVDQKYKPFLTC